MDDVLRKGDAVWKGDALWNADVLWKAAGKLRGSVDAAQYRDFVLGLVFLKYVSDSSDDGGFRVPDGARWADLSPPPATSVRGSTRRWAPSCAPTPRWTASSRRSSPRSTSGASASWSS
ncbi:type I restriction-modification system subunit M N-terminal domain-containing protein [Actinomadura luteofluorescens]|uniref:type I restriction-modification system subunit M N-terminal domain-containing protein n=1 Tax=Actinomadura luteofluorescens TaxID=46163 RepID=UPI0036456906